MLDKLKSFFQTFWLNIIKIGKTLFKYIIPIGIFLLVLFIVIQKFLLKNNNNQFDFNKIVDEFINRSNQHKTNINNDINNIDDKIDKIKQDQLDIKNRQDQRRKEAQDYIKSLKG
jgi:peptidoglycan hydrolase CwlO-like protein